MINRTYSQLKLSRTYLGGSKKEEFAIFARIQGIKDDNSDCDWLEYRRILFYHINDILHVILSWKILTRKISLILLLIGIFCFRLPIISFSLIGLSVIIMFIHMYLIRFLNIKSGEFNMCIAITLSEIKRLTGLEITE